MATFSDWLWNVRGGIHPWCGKMIKGIWIPTTISKIKSSRVSSFQLRRKCWSLPAKWWGLDRIAVSMPIAVNAGWIFTGTTWFGTSRVLAKIWGLGFWYRWSLLDSKSDRLAFKVSSVGGASGPEKHRSVPTPTTRWGTPSKGLMDSFGILTEALFPGRGRALKRGMTRPWRACQVSRYNPW